MKNYILILFVFVSNFCIAQVDSISYKIDSTTIKKNRFYVAANVIKNSVLSVPGDFSEMGHTLSNNWKRTAYYTAGIVGLIATDKITTGFWHDHIEPTIKYQLPIIDIKKFKVNWLGKFDPYIIYPIVGLYSGSFIINNKKGQIVSINAAKSITYSFVISNIILKTLSARNRPLRDENSSNISFQSYTKDNWDFGNFHKIYLGSNPAGTSFPSFHATAYYAVAKVFQMEYNNYWIPYTFATGVFLADIKSHNHWVSDLLVGGLVGTIIGKSVVNSSRKQIQKDNYTALNYNPRKFKMSKQLIPQISSSMVGLHFVGSF